MSKSKPLPPLRSESSTIKTAVALAPLDSKPPAPMTLEEIQRCLSLSKAKPPHFEHRAIEILAHISRFNELAETMKTDGWELVAVQSQEKHVSMPNGNRGLSTVWITFWKRPAKEEKSA